jgi:hypothetical protein
MSTIMPVLNLILPVLDAVFCEQTWGKPLCKSTSQYTVIHTMHSPTISWLHITREARNTEHLLNVNNNLQKYINLTWVPLSLLDLPLAANSIICYISNLWHHTL